MIKLLKTRQNYRQALDGELATAQCLEPVIAGGGKIFHDFQAEGFNIDHVVVSAAGVFAVETKHRLKPTDVSVKEMAKVQFDGQTLAEDRKKRLCFQLEQRCQESAEANNKK